MGPLLNIGLAEALDLTLTHITPLTQEILSLDVAVDRVAAEELRAMVDSPSVDASLKDGYAVRSGEVASAGSDTPVRLKLAGYMAAGGARAAQLPAASATRVLTGAGIPGQADAVVSEEFTTIEGDTLVIRNFAEPGRNILPKGSDVAAGEVVAHAGQLLSPGMVGLLAAAGHSRISAVRRPMVAILATGDEVVAPGRPLPEGKLYASNMVTLGAWCRRYGMDVTMEIARDDAEAMGRAVAALITRADALLTSGGAWTGDRDLIARVLAQMGWRGVFHRIRMGPGKAVGFGLLDGKPVFILPGGPPSNLMAFLQIALPGLLRLGGHRQTGLPQTTVALAGDLKGRDIQWTQFRFGRLDRNPDIPKFLADRQRSRLRSMAEATAIVALPEGQPVLTAGTLVRAQVLT